MTDGVEQIIAELRDNPVKYFGLHPRPTVEILQVRDNPNSATVRLRLSFGAEVRTLYIKRLVPERLDGLYNRSDLPFKRNQIVTEHGIIFTLHRAFEPHPDLGVVRPVACFPEWLSLVTEECAGQSVAALFQNAKVYSPRRGAEQLSAVCLRAGNWLRLFQDWTAQSEGMVNLEEIVEYVRVRLDVLALHAESEFDSRRREQIARLVATLLSQVRPNELKMVGRHNDYAPNNMLVANNRLTVLDFGGFNYGPIYRDICKFWFKLEELQIGFLVSARTVSMAQQAFWSGYGTRVDLSHPLCVAIKIAYGLDKLGDMLADWNRTPFFKRPALRQLYAHYTDYIRATGHRLGI